MTIEEAFRLRVLQILDGEGILVQGIETQDTPDGKAGVAFTFQHEFVADQYVERTGKLSTAVISVMISHETPGEIWRVARLIRLGLAEKQSYWPSTGTRRRVHWIRPTDGSTQGVIDDPKLFVERAMYVCCFDDTDDGLIAD